jgi:hypothetical protein
VQIAGTSGRDVRPADIPQLLARIGALSCAVESALSTVDADIASARLAWVAEAARGAAHEDAIRKVLDRSFSVAPGAALVEGEGQGGSVGGVGFLGNSGGAVASGGGGGGGDAHVGAAPRQYADDDERGMEGGAGSQEAVSSNASPSAARASKRRQGVAQGDVASV